VAQVGDDFGNALKLAEGDPGAESHLQDFQLLADEELSERS
jgi:hypothetical protein